MVRVAADTLKTNRTPPASTAAASDAVAATPARRSGSGRRTTASNGAQQRPPETEVEAGTEAEPGAMDAVEADASVSAEGQDDSAELETTEQPIPQRRGPAPAPAATRRTVAAAQPAVGDGELSDSELLVLGKLTRFALENGLTVHEMAERLRNMVAVYDRASGAF